MEGNTNYEQDEVIAILGRLQTLAAADPSLRTVTSIACVLSDILLNYYGQQVAASGSEAFSEEQVVAAVAAGQGWVAVAAPQVQEEAAEQEPEAITYH